MDTWSWNEAAQIGGGGFGRVYEAQGPSSGPVVAKVVPKAEGATRELLVGQDLPRSPHFVPVLHVEEMDEAWVIYMPRADHSLRERLNESLTSQEALSILLELTDALAALSPSVVHRDLKPDNILMLNGKWAICDFGISRYADAATADDTRKYSFTASYAAPEQWRFEHATSATDVYAFGVIAHEVLSGRRPFEGSREQLRDQHLNTQPELLPGNRKLAWLVFECLQKAPQARPTAENLKFRLERASEEVASRGASALASAQTAVLAAHAAAQSEAEAARTEAERRSQLFDGATHGYKAILEQFVEFIRDNAPATTITEGTSLTLSLGAAQLILAPLSPASPTRSPYDVIAYGSIRVEGQGLSRSHSLYYADFDAPQTYRWYELAFTGTFQAVDFSNEPRSLAPSEGLPVFDNVIGGSQLGFGILPLDPGDPETFIESWSDRFGRAANGQFPRVYQLPDGRTSSPAWRGRN